MALFNSKYGEEVLVVVHETTAGALALKACAPAYCLEGRLIPVPRTLSAGCGMAWSEPARNKAHLECALAQEDVEYSRVVAMKL
jgi:hypothetical protein